MGKKADKECLIKQISSLNLKAIADWLEDTSGGYHGMDKPRNRRLFQRRDASVVLVGNGPVSENIGELIDQHDIVVRFNNYTKVVEKVGKKIDIHVVNTHPGYEVTDALTLIMEHHSKYTIRKTLENSSRIKQGLYRDALDKCGDLTRGFWGILMFTQLFDRVHIVGFGGKGHHTDPKHFVAHSVKEEHAVIDDMISRGELHRLQPDSSISRKGEAFVGQGGLLIGMLVATIALTGMVGMLYHRKISASLGALR